MSSGNCDFENDATNCYDKIYDSITIFFENIN